MAKPTPSQTVGPFFARDLLWKDGGTVLFPGRSDRITLTGRVFDGDGAPIHDALFETWQADPTGAFAVEPRRRPASRLRPRLDGPRRTLRDRDGRAGILQGPEG